MLDDANISTLPVPRLARAEKILRKLEHLSDRGMALADCVADQGCATAKAAPETPTGRGLTEAFNRVSRDVRYTVVLEAMFADYHAALCAGDPRVEFWPRGSRQKNARSGDSHDPETKPEPDRMERRDQLHGFVLDLANPMSYEPVARERIYENLHERLYESERYDAILDLPLEHAVEAICKDLGVRPQYERWEGLDWPPWRVGKPAPDPSAWPSGAPEPASEPAREPEHEEAFVTTGIPPHPPPWGDPG